MGYLGAGAATPPTPRTLTNFRYPLGLPGETDESSARVEFLAWSPDARHLAAAIFVYRTTPSGWGSYAIYPYLVTVSSGAFTRLILPTYPSADGLPDNRILAWADNDTLLILGGNKGEISGSGGTVSYAYRLSTGAATPLPGVTSAAAGVVRCSVLYYLELTPFTEVGITESDIDIAGPSRPYTGNARLHRYDLRTHRELSAPIALGATRARLASVAGTLIFVDAMGWDVARDGTRLVYQRTSTAVVSGRLRTNSTFLSAADGTRPLPILAGMPPDPDSAQLGLSLDGALVAASGVGDPMFAPGSDRPTSLNPSLFTGSTAGGIARPYRGHGPISLTGGLPAWEVYGTFIACQRGATVEALERFSPATPPDPADHVTPSMAELHNNTCNVAVLP